MKKAILFITLILIWACKSEKPDENTLHKTSENSEKEEVIILKAPEIEIKLPIVNDSLFFDFFDAFMWHVEFQKSRIVFPFQKDTIQILKAENWEYLPFYTDNDFLPVLLSDSINLYEKQIEGSKIALNVLNGNLKTGIRYDFEQKEKKWLLVNASSISDHKVPDLEFLEFLATFSNDTIYQQNHIRFPLSQLVSDYDNNYEILETALLKEDWEHLSLTTYLEDLMIISDFDETSKFRNIIFHGIENGISVKYTFEKIKGQWMLIHHVDIST